MRRPRLQTLLVPGTAAHTVTWLLQVQCGTANFLILSRERNVNKNQFSKKISYFGAHSGLYSFAFCLLRTQAGQEQPPCWTGRQVIQGVSMCDLGWKVHGLSLCDPGQVVHGVSVCDPRWEVDGLSLYDQGQVAHGVSVCDPRWVVHGLCLCDQG